MQRPNGNAQEMEIVAIQTITSIPRLPCKAQGEPPVVVRDTTTQGISFNVMANRPVRETIEPSEYRIWYRYLEAEFDRKYCSTMVRSPDHLIFLTALIQIQKLLYIYTSHEFRLGYDPLGTERLKIWPTRVNVEMPKMLIENEGLVHRLTVTALRNIGEKKFFAKSRSDVNGLITIQASGFVYLL